MNKTLYTLVLTILSLGVFSQTDTVYFSEQNLDSKIDNRISITEKKISSEISELPKQVQKDIAIKISELKTEINKSIEDAAQLSNAKNNSTKTQLLDSIAKQQQRILKLEGLLKNNENELNKTSSELKSTKENISSVKNDTENKISNLDESVSSKSLMSLVLILTSFGLAIVLFFLLKKRLSKDTNKLDGQISSTRTALEAEHMKLDQKLIELLDTQLQIQKEERQTTPTKKEEIDHSLALKVADEIVRMQRNIGNMPSETKGLKQLNKALQRIQDTFKVNGYEMIEMLGKPFNEGMKVVANFTPDENLDRGEQIITRIIKPQVNFNGVMIQSAQIEVSIGE